MVDFKKVKAPNNTVTRNPAVFQLRPGIFMRQLLLLQKEQIRFLLK